ncbi:HNH endonuclease signature motif containing protein [Corynebacterium cystitidis]|uniref:HNH endonuclease signature motif containing protein n=1 Tax=Corynebacterium cystitidis TaxID=35757 RepID=UPI00211E8473|nr:HNH endonuclease signature motif containing protein [Corynebacterium cystitidis]
MNLVELLTCLGTSAMPLIAQFGELSDKDIRDIRARGAEAEPLSSIRKLHSVYFGSTSFTRKQHDARKSAQRGKLGLQRLKSIENYADRLKDSTRKWPLREELTTFEGSDYDFQRHANERVRAYNTATAAAAESEAAANAGVADQPEEVHRSMTITHHEGTTEASLTVRGPSSEIRAAEQIARQRAEDEGISPADAMLAGMCSSTSDSGRAVRAVVKVLVPLPQVKALRNGEGRDAILHCDNGALVTGNELLAMEIAPIAEYVGLTNMDGAVTISTGPHPFSHMDARADAKGAAAAADQASGPPGPPGFEPTTSANTSVNTPTALRRSELEREEARRAACGEPPIPPATKAKALARFATYKDRCLLEAEQTVCAGEGCSVPVSRTQVNHNIPHSKGGLTLARNMSLLCDYHNGKAGATESYVKIGAVTYRILPGGKLVRNRHPLAV